MASIKFVVLVFAAAMLQAHASPFFKSPSEMIKNAIKGPSQVINGLKSGNILEAVTSPIKDTIGGLTVSVEADGEADSEGGLSGRVSGGISSKLGGKLSSKVDSLKEKLSLDGLQDNLKEKMNLENLSSGKLNDLIEDIKEKLNPETLKDLASPKKIVDMIKAGKKEAMINAVMDIIEKFTNIDGLKEKLSALKGIKGCDIIKEVIGNIDVEEIKNILPLDKFNTEALKEIMSGTDVEKIKDIISKIDVENLKEKLNTGAVEDLLSKIDVEEMKDMLSLDKFDPEALKEMLSKIDVEEMKDMLSLDEVTSEGLKELLSSENMQGIVDLATKVVATVVEVEKMKLAMMKEGVEIAAETSDEALDGVINSMAIMDSVIKVQSANGKEALTPDQLAGLVEIMGGPEDFKRIVSDSKAHTAESSKAIAEWKEKGFPLGDPAIGAQMSDFMESKIQEGIAIAAKSDSSAAQGKAKEAMKMAEEGVKKVAADKAAAASKAAAEAKAAAEEKLLNGVQNSVGVMKTIVEAQTANNGEALNSKQLAGLVEAMGGLEAFNDIVSDNAKNAPEASKKIAEWKSKGFPEGDAAFGKEMSDFMEGKIQEGIANAAKSTSSAAQEKAKEAMKMAEEGVKKVAADKAAAAEKVATEALAATEKKVTEGVDSAKKATSEVKSTIGGLFG